MKKVLIWLMALVMLFGCAAAAAAESSSVQIYDKYYTSTGDVVDNVTVSNNSRYDDVVISKTIAGTGVENEFDITLTVKTKEEIISSTEAPDAAVVLVLDISSSMSSASIDAMEAAANTFLDSFASDADGGMRKAAIVTYNRDVILTSDWKDAKDLNCPTNLNSSQGTNTHGGLLRAQRLLQQSSYDGVSASDFEYRYIVLMTDGEPTRYLTDSAISSGSWIGTSSNNTSTSRSKAQAVAESIHAMDGVELYAIGYDLTANGTDENWLKNSVASTASHYFRANISGLQSQFEAIANAMKISASAWVVTDPMAAGVTLLNTDGSSAVSVSGSTLEWNLRGVTPTASTAGSVTTYTYTTTYRVKLDTLAAGFAEDNWYRTNGNTSLTYWIEQDGQYLNNNHQVISSPTLDNAIMTMYFNVPAVEGYKGDLSFIKVDDAGNPLSGVSFTAAVKGGSWSDTAVSGSDGVVNMTGLPSGHTYVLTETTPEGYLENEAIEFAVSYGEVDYASFEKNAAGQPVVVNTRETGDAAITVTKVFEGVEEADLPASLDVTAVNQANAELRYTATLYQADGYTADITVLAPGTYIVSETAPEIDGYNLESIAYTAPNADNTASIVTVAIDGTAAVTITNTYNKQEASLTISKTFEGDALTDAQKAGISFTVSGPDGYSTTIPYSQFQNDSYTLSGLALGTYTVTETADVTGYVVETAYSVNGQAANSVTLADGDEATMAVANTYNKQEGGLMLTKSFTGDAITDEQKAGITFTVTGPDGYSKAIAYSEFTNGQYNLGSVPLGAYTIVESNADVDGYIRTTSHTTDVQPMVRMRMASNATSADYTVNVEITDDNAHTIAITNDYNKQEASLTITKTFAGELDEVTEAYKNAITFTVTGPAGFEQTVSYADFVDGSYTFTGLALGEYTVAEGSTELNHYNVETTGAGSVTLADGDEARMSITNTYAAQPGSLKVTKHFSADSALTGSDFADGIDVTVTAVEGGQTYTATLCNANIWTYTFTGLVPGEYTVTETSTHDANYYTLSAVFTGLTNGAVTVLPGETRAADVTITNTYTLGQASVLGIPFEKLVSLGKGGNVPPMGETTFYFNLDLQLAQPMMLRSTNAVQPGALEVEYYGALQPSDLPAYDFMVTVNGPNIGEGWIVIRGNAYDLQRLTATITESEFGMMERWEYEAGPDFAWTVTAQQQSDGSFAPVMTDAEGSSAAAVHFDNCYTQVADIPATGDDSHPLLWTMLMAVCAACFALVFKRRQHC